MILVLSEAIDIHATEVVERLKHRGVKVFQFDPAFFPAQADFSLAYSSCGQPRYLLRTGEGEIDLCNLQAVWYRRPKTPIPPASVTVKRTRDYLAEECRTFVHNLWSCLNCPWVPGPPDVIRRAESKALQLQIAGTLGFELPPTLFSNSPKDFLEFYREHNGQVVYKLVGPSFARYAEEFVRYTEVVSRRDLCHIHAVRSCPLIFQAYVPKRVELRITVVGREVFAVEIHSQQTNHTRHDWRRYDYAHTPYLQHELPPEVKQRCLGLVEKLGLCYGAIDMVVTPDGRYVFLEINPNGQYLWVEQATGLPISDTIASLLSESVDCEPQLLGELS